MKYILKNCSFIPQLTQGGLSNGDILIENGLIARVSKKIECDCESIDMENKFVLPGFIDLHVHLTLSGNDVLYDNFKSDYYMSMMAYRFALDSLKGGFTTIRDVGSNVALVNSVRDAINDELLCGPTILSSGLILSPTENGNEYFSKMYRECDGKYDMIAGVRAELKNGADFIKVMSSGAIMNPGGEPGSPVMSDEELQSIVDTAKIKNKYVAAHAHSNKAIIQCIKIGVRTIEHASLIDDDSIELLKDNTNTYIVPTITAIAGLKGSDDASFMNDKINEFAQDFKTCLTKAYNSGLEMGFGTDQGITSTYHGENADEFMYRQELLGVSNLDLLKQATCISAKIAQVDDVLGDIYEGKYADLVVLGKNPLDDISACKDCVIQVFKKGIKIK